jgi:hypothetical protein
MKPIGPTLAIATIAAIATACGVPSSNAPSTTATTTAPTTSSADPAVELAAARQRWEKTGPDTYWLELVNDCGECDPAMREPRTVVVWSGRPVGSGNHTVESLFSQVETAIAEGRNVEVSYHAATGHPTEISIDMQDRAFDGGHHLLVEDLVAGLPGQDVGIEALEEARSIWENGRPEAYEYRTTIHCDCEIDGRIRTQVEGNRIIDWDVDYRQKTDTTISPLTIDMMFDDLAEMLSLAEGVEADGVRFTGSAAYDADLGYPTWIGLDIEVLDPDSELAFLPSRIVFAVDQFLPVQTSPDSLTELEDARALWKTSAFNSYRYELRIHDIENASYSDPYVIDVVNGAVVSVEHEGAVVEPATFALPIIDVFDVIDEAMRQGQAVETLYHDELGYPVFFSNAATSEVFSIHALTPTG